MVDVHRQLLQYNGAMAALKSNATGARNLNTSVACVIEAQEGGSRKTSRKMPFAGKRAHSASATRGIPRLRRAPSARAQSSGGEAFSSCGRLSETSQQEREVTVDVSSNIEQLSEDTTEETITVIGFGRRLIATLTDGILLAAFTFIVAFAIGFVGIFIQMFNPNEPLPLSQLIIVSGLVLSVIYYVGYWSSSGQTIGNTLWGIKVVSTDGSSLSRGKALLRYFGYIVSAVVLSLGFLWAAFDRKRQGWHDKIAGTYVV